MGNIDGAKGYPKDSKVFDWTDLEKVRKGDFNALTYIPLIVSHPLIPLYGLPSSFRQVIILAQLRADINIRA